jgi:hypothetical protein
MDTSLIELALQKAIDAGAVPAPPLPPPTHRASDVNIVRAETDVGLEQQALDELIADLARDSVMQQFNSTFITMPTGGGLSTNR